MITTPTFPSLRSSTPALGPAYALGSGRTRKLSERQKQVRNNILTAEREYHYEHVACLCGQTEAFVVLSQVDRHGLPYRAVLCDLCGTIRCTPRWNQQRYELFYADQYRDLYNQVSQSKRAYSILQQQSHASNEIALWIQKSWSSVSTTNPAPTVLEVGAGAGWNLACLPENWRKIGFDVDEDYLEIGRIEFGLDMRKGFLTETLLDVEKADIILLSHLVEHLLDPIGDLQALGNHMKDDSLLCIEVPGIFRIHSSNLDVMSYMQNAHTFTFCKQTLSETIQSAGFQILYADEHVRATAIKGKGFSSHPASVHNGRFLSKTILAYLQKCEARYSLFHPLTKLPFGNRRLVNLLRKTVFKNLFPPALAETSIRPS